MPRRSKFVTVILLLFFHAICAFGQAPGPSPELRRWDIWIGDWSLSGTARDTAASPEYKVNWHLHEHWVLGGMFVQVDQQWEANGQKSQALEMLGYDVTRKIHTSAGFSSDGSTWNLTATFEGNKTVEVGESKAPNGEVVQCTMTWLFSDDRQSVSGTQQCEQNGARWTSISVKGTKRN